jgi:hypothetical protein
MSGEGKINIQRGAAFRVHGILELGGGGRNRWVSSLEPILSSEERDQRSRDAEKELEEIIDSYGD